MILCYQMESESRLAKRSGGKQPIPMLVSSHISIVVMSFFNGITDDTGSQSIRRSVRSNKGSGGQIAHLQNIERIQTERTTTSRQLHAAQLEKATTNELLNPMAPMKSKPKPRVKAPPTREPDINARSSLTSVCKILHFYRCDYS